MDEGIPPMRRNAPVNPTIAKTGAAVNRTRMMPV
jgi:hypothetical protein